MGELVQECNISSISSQLLDPEMISLADLPRWQLVFYVSFLSVGKEVWPVRTCTIIFRGIHLVYLD